MRSVSALDLVLVDSGDGLKVSGPATAGALAILGLERPSILMREEIHFLRRAAG